ncbi:MAG: histidinol dehydrogenase [Actinomycetota bacterium]
MIARIDIRGCSLDRATLQARLPRSEYDVAAALSVVHPICEEVRLAGADGVRDLGERFDGVRVRDLRVPPEALTAALEQLEPQVRSALEEAIRRARLVHRAQRRADVTTQVVPGGTVTERWVPVSRVGLYVPGGVAVLVSSVVMNAVPAQEAGVPSIALASPPQRDNPAVFAGMPHPMILAACAMLEIHEVYAVGGAQAIAMFAYGAKERSECDDEGEVPSGAVVCEPVDMVTGPGNIYVVAAKRLLKGVIGIDSEAGPTEIAILADQSANPEHLAADLLSQAEHDPLASAVLVTDSEKVAEAVERELATQVDQAKHGERIKTALTGRQSAIVLVDDLDAGVHVVDAYAAEHVEIQTIDATTRALQVRNAGAIFVGSYAPVSLGDYCAGSNHVLPTGGSARHSSGLSVQSFLRGIHVVEYDQMALAHVAEHVIALAEAEDLPGHAEAIRVRQPNRWKPS